MDLLLMCGGGEPYPIEDRAALVAAVEEEAAKIAADAGSDLLAEPTDGERAALAKQVTKDMLSRLWRAGDSYKAPDGSVYKLRERA